MDTLTHVGEINAKLLRRLLSECPQRLILCSPGGDNYIMGAVCDHLDGTAVDVLGTGEICSAAVAIVACGNHRVATPRTRFMVHHPWADSISGTARQVRVEHDELKVCEEIYLDILTEHTTMPKRHWATLFRRGDAYFDAEQAQAWGLVDEIA